LWVKLLGVCHITLNILEKETLFNHQKEVKKVNTVFSTEHLLTELECH